ncbi:transcriptional regulator [Uliginosibacterium gangwonense]|uniref:transcriptional regulator n=1 Tax=Uliginosibacterium gangwonense TaxID=392736 RepID=UPI0003630110|nr:Cro/CI family transcriptional regulator [Uliginosibacterium gangwonense]
MKLQSYLSSHGWTQGKLARRLGVTQGAVSQWLKGVRPIPIERCVEIEQATGGVVTRQELRTDWALIWPELSVVLRRELEARKAVVQEGGS